MCVGMCIEIKRVDVMCLPRLCSSLNFDTGSPSEPRVHWFYYTSWLTSPRNSFVSTSPALGFRGAELHCFHLAGHTTNSWRQIMSVSAEATDIYCFVQVFFLNKELEIRHSCCIPSLFTGWFSRTIWTDFECMVLCHEFYIHH